jgi:hypothetical protein
MSPPPDDLNILSLIRAHPPPPAVAAAACAGAAIVVACGSAVVHPLPPGAPRLLAIAPLLLILSALPLALPPSVVLRGSAAFLCWLAASKLLALACGRGALALHGLSAPQRALLLALPLTPEPRRHHRPPAPPHPPNRWPRAAAFAAFNASVLAVLIVVLRQDGGAGGGGGGGSTLLLPLPPFLSFPLRPLVRHALYACVVYAAVSLVLDCAAPPALAWARLPPLRPSMKAPWAARSLADFWGSCYNLAVSEALKQCAYAPVVERSLVSRRPREVGGANAQGGAGGEGGGGLHRQRVTTGRRACGLLLVFLMSGLAHEIIVSGYMCGAAEQQRGHLWASSAAADGGGNKQQRQPPYRRAPGLMMAFFLAQVPALLLERQAHEWRRQRRQRRQEQEQSRRGGQDGAPPAGAEAKRAVEAKREGGAPKTPPFFLLPFLARALRSVLTLLCLLLMTSWAFFPAMEACGVDQAGIAEVGAAIDAAAAAAAAGGWWPRQR